MEVAPATVVSPKLTWVVAILCAAAVFIAFYPSLFNGFNYDDEKNIIENHDYRGLGADNLRWMFTTFHMGHYQPLSWVSLGLDYVIWQKNALGYHLTNLLLHCANAVLVYLIAMYFLQRPDRRPIHAVAWPQVVGAAAAALLFGLHPLRVESVAWVTERRDVLSSFFLLMTILIYLQAHRRDSRLTATSFALLLALYCLSLLSRAMGVTLPLILILLDWYPLRRIGGPAGRWFGSTARRVWLEKVPFAICAAAAAAVAPMAQHVSDATISLERHGVLGRFAQAAYGLVFYLWKSVWPTRLVPLYELRLPIELTRWQYPVSALAVLVLGLFAWRVARSRPAITLALASYAILLLPVLGFVQSGPQEVADRYTYLATIGFAVLIGAGQSTLLEKRHPSGILVAPAIAAACGVLAILTWQQCKIWDNPMTLWTHALAYGPPSCQGNYNMGCELARQGRHREAIEHYRNALDLNRKYYETWYNMGNALSEIGELEASVRAYSEAEKLKPDNRRPYYERGRVLSEMGRTDEAIEAFRASLARDPNYAQAIVNLGAMLARKNDHRSAIEQYQKAIALRPEIGEGHYNLAISLEAVGKVSEALASYRKAIETTPNFPDARVNLGNLLLKQGRQVEARREYEEALRQDPSHAAARANLDQLNRVR